jgi:hypothetical protein
MSTGDADKPPVAMGQAIELVACAPAPVVESPLPPAPALAITTPAVTA